MGRVRPVREGNLEAHGWLLDEPDPPFAPAEPIVPGSRVLLTFVFETGERGPGGRPVLEAENIPVHVLRAEGAGFTGVMLDPPVTPASVCVFSEVRFQAAHVMRQVPRAKLDRAFAEADAAVEREPKSWQLLMRRGRANEDRGDLQAAIADYTLAIDLGGAGARVSRGIAYGVVGDEDAARADLERSLIEAREGGAGVEMIGMIDETLGMLRHAYGAASDG